MNNEELKVILDNHKLWIQDYKAGACADLRGADLSGGMAKLFPVSWDAIMSNT